MHIDGHWQLALSTMTVAYTHTRTRARADVGDRTHTLEYRGTGAGAGLDVNLCTEIGLTVDGRAYFATELCTPLVVKIQTIGHNQCKTAGTVCECFFFSSKFAPSGGAVLRACRLKFNCSNSRGLE